MAQSAANDRTLLGLEPSLATPYIGTPIEMGTLEYYPEAGYPC